MAASCTTALHALYRPIRVAYPGRSESSTAVWVRYAKAHWRKISVAALCGIFIGFVGGVMSSQAGSSLDRVVYAAAPATPHIIAKAGVSAPDTATAAEVSRLKAENQQLQTLVDTLRKHPVAAHSRHAKAHRRRHWRAG